MWPLKKNHCHMATSEYAEKLLVFGLSYADVRTLTYTHTLSLFLKTPATKPNAVNACISGFSNAVGLNLPAQISDH